MDKWAFIMHYNKTRRSRQEFSSGFNKTATGCINAAVMAAIYVTAVDLKLLAAVMVHVAAVSLIFYFFIIF
jgi:hypothetical protein